MSTLVAPRPAPEVREAAAGGALLPLWLARGGVLLAFAAFAGLHWAGLLEPAEPARAWQAVGVATLTIAGLLGAARLRRPLVQPAAVLVALAGTALALLAGGVADEYLRPDRWGDLLAGIGRGIDSLPGVRVPYRGLDEWTRLTISVGGAGLTLLAALLAFWPRRGRTGFPIAALLALVTLYVVPAVVLDFDGEFLRGAVLALLLVAFLRLEKLRVRDAPAAGAVALLAALGALIVAPALDGSDPWFDYESWAVETAGARALSYSWDHDYGPLDWSRDGRELLRVKATEPAYWKARDLDRFDGQGWRQDARASGEDPASQLPASPGNVDRWTERIVVSVRNLRSTSFVGAGITTAIDGEVNYPVGGGVFNAPDGLGRGDSYAATVYYPAPSARQLAGDSDEHYEDWMRRYLTVSIGGPSLALDDPPAERSVPIAVTWPAWGEDGKATAERYNQYYSSGAAALADSNLERIWRLSRELKAGTDTAYEYVRRVEGYLDDGFAYSETPPRASRTLDGFLFESKIGFCQQYSGAEALLLRMGGVPARVATGFTSGAYDAKQREFVVRDFDAHSWVEAWFPGYGWVTRDPTPAAAPPRAQPGENSGGSLSGRLPGVPSLGGERLSDLESNRGRAPGEGTNWLTYAIAGVIAALLLAAGAFYERRRRRRLPPPAQRPLAEFERALRRARYDGGPGMTLSRIERSFAGWPGAAGYVRALREQRYSGRQATPTPEQRRGLRAALARDAGMLRSWWALPPRRT